MPRHPTLSPSYLAEAARESAGLERRHERSGRIVSLIALLEHRPERGRLFDWDNIARVLGGLSPDLFEIRGEGEAGNTLTHALAMHGQIGGHRPPSSAPAECLKSAFARGVDPMALNALGCPPIFYAHLDETGENFKLLLPRFNHAFRAPDGSSLGMACAQRPDLLAQIVDRYDPEEARADGHTMLSLAAGREACIAILERRTLMLGSGPSRASAPFRI